MLHALRACVLLPNLRLLYLPWYSVVVTMFMFMFSICAPVVDWSLRQNTVMWLFVLHCWRICEKKCNKSLLMIKQTCVRACVRACMCKIFLILLPPSAMITLHKTTTMRILHCTNNNAYTYKNSNKLLKLWKIDQKWFETFQMWCWREWTRSVQQNAWIMK